MPEVFISYARADSDYAYRLTQALKKRGIGVFLDSESLVAGESWEPKINREIESSDAVAVLLSHNSKRSSWVEKELVYALENEKHVIPVLLDSEGKQNWVWPLVADRAAWRLDENSDFAQLADRIQEAILTRSTAEGSELTDPSFSGAETASRKQISTSKIESIFNASPYVSTLVRWVNLVLLAVISALIGGLIVWLLL